MLVVLVMSMATRAWARHDGSHGHPGQSTADQAQMRELLSKLAAASGTPEPEEKTDADLMYEAMLRWNPAPAGSAAVDRLIDSSKKEVAKSKRATQEKVRRMFWKDPFADDPSRLVLVRQEDRDLLDTYQRKTRRNETREERPSLNLTSEVARLRRELAQARADAEEARAEAERAKDRADRRGSCVADASVTGGEVRKRRHVGSSYRSNPDRAPAQQIALATTAPQISLPPPQPVTPPPAPIPAHGIIIEPLPSPPPPPPVVETRARRGSRMR